MSPGVPQDSNYMDYNSESSSSSSTSSSTNSSTNNSSSSSTANQMLRMGRGRDISDIRAVGSHLTLSKRNSTPVGVGMGGMGVIGGCSSRTSNPTTTTTTTPQSEHRRLDRCHSEPSKGPGNSSRYKTELCRPFEEHGFCKYGDKCQFAHGGNELRNLSRHPKYKTELCRTFHTIGFCPYGPRCHFIHNAEERRGTPPPPQTPTGKIMMSDAPSPPSSIHGSPTSPNAFFDDSFSLFPRNGFFESLTVGLSAVTPSQVSPSPNHSLPTLDTPPISPVESLAGDLDSLSLSSSSHSTSPTPHPPLAMSHSLDISRSLRLPIFEQLCEHE